MTDAFKLAALCGFSVFGVLVSFSCASLSAAIAIAALAFSALLPWLHRVLPDASRHEGVWELAPIAAFLPLVLVRITTPGADAAMYAAIARALLQHSPDLSTAYPGIRVAMYPRAFPGLVAVLSPVFGMLKANLVAAMVCYVVFVTGLAFWLRGFVSRRAALIAALLIALVSRNVPLGFFSWGGNATILAFGMALTAILVAADATHALVLGCGALILGGAFAAHPIGALGGAACAPIVLLQPGRSHGPRAARVLIIALAVAPLMLSFKYFGPVMSAGESEWIARWQAGPARLLHDRFGFMPLDYLEAFTRTCGPVLTALTCLSIGRAIVAREPSVLWLLGAGLFYIAVLMLAGPRLPLLGTFIYADRLSPMWLVAISPLLAVTVSHARLPARPIQIGASALLVGLAHLYFRIGEPLLDEDEFALTECIRAKIPADAWIVASYGQGGQWLPALTGNPITQAHTHCSLFDEADATRSQIQAHYQLISRHRPQFNVPELPELPAAETLCEHGGAKLVRLLEVAPPIAGVH